MTLPAQTLPSIATAYLRNHAGELGRLPAFEKQKTPQRLQDTLELLSRLDVPKTTENIVGIFKETPFPFLQVLGALGGWVDLIFIQKFPLFYGANALANVSGLLSAADLAVRAAQAGRPDLEGKIWHQVQDFSTLPKYLRKKADAFGQPSIAVSQLLNNTFLLALISAPSTFVGETGRICSTMMGGLFSAGMENKYRIIEMQKTGVFDPLAHFGDIYNLSTPDFYKRLATFSLNKEDTAQLSTFKAVMTSDFKRGIRQALGLLLPIDFHEPIVHEAHRKVEYLKVNSAFTPEGLTAWKTNWKNALNFDPDVKPQGNNFGKYSLWGLSGFGYLGVGMTGLSYPVLEFLGQREENKQAGNPKVKVGVNPYGYHEQKKTSLHPEKENTKLKLSHKIRKSTDLIMGFSRLTYYLGGLILYWNNRNLAQSAVSIAKIIFGFGHTSRWAYWKNHILNATIAFENQTIGKQDKQWLVFRPK
jgi:hypothetical protein